MYASALAILDSDPGARCGAWEVEFEKVRMSDLARSGRASKISETIDAGLAKAKKAFSKGRYRGSLAVLFPLISGIDKLENNSCYSSQRSKAEERVKAAGLALAPMGKKRLSGLLPKDPVGKPLEVVRRASRRLRAERRTQQETSSRLENPSSASNAEAEE